MTLLSLQTAIGAVILIVGSLFWYRTGRYRDVRDVVADLKLSRVDREESSRSEAGNPQGVPALFSRRSWFLPLMCGSLLFGAGTLAGHVSAAKAVVLVFMGCCLGYLANGAWERHKLRTSQRTVEFFLPIVMERLVMAVEAGLDILPAIQSVVELEERSSDSPDSVSLLLSRVLRRTEAGMGFEQSLTDISGCINCPALKHAFVHLSIAHREGGELIMPLRELSDATQLYFQETVEEEIAKMPVKATMPLLLTFAGLMICFLTSPIIEVMTIVARSVPR